MVCPELGVVPDAILSPPPRKPSANKITNSKPLMAAVGMSHFGGLDDVVWSVMGTCPIDIYSPTLPCFSETRWGFMP
jgi:hypothetical protein